ncbi:MAG: enoyl-CoA hydratase/isomerase family protein [Alphaproteobacteria bacterium]|nr:enoyl-CoA hydratase/isomerase family protein [Alphaproteobacteria bacterium]
MVAINNVTTLEVQDGIAVLTIDSPPVNALSGPVRQGLYDGIHKALADAEAKAIVLICGGRTFIAGADISEFGKPGGTPTVGLNETFEAIENATKPVVAAIHGTALGGGLEVALTCHYRVAVPSARAGLPEVKLGLLPGAGGTQRLPRLVGAEKALALMTSGDQISAAEAVKSGVFDAVVEGDLKTGAIAFAKSVVGKPSPRVRDRDEKVAADRGNAELFAAFRKKNARAFRGQKAPELIIQCIEAAVNLPFDEGIAVERTLFGKLIVSPESAAMRHIFFAERQAAKIPDVPDQTPVLPVKKVGVIGAGTMGGGISMNFLNAGIPVAIVEMKQEALDRGIGVMRKNYENTAKKGRITEADVEKRMGLLTGSLELESLNDCDLIIEAVFENMAIKKDVFARLDKVAKPGAILASNTSYLDVNEIASATARPESVIGLHFFSPANVMRLLEIVRGDKTSKEVIATSMKLAKTIGKVGVLVGVCPGFVGNRMLSQRQQQANALVNEGAMPWDVDRVLYDFGFPMGPFAMSDLAGLDIGWSKEASSSSTIREVLCEMDRRGQKTGAGFYDYDENRNARPSPVTEKIIREFAAKSGVNPREITDQEILERTIYPMINEGAKILEEKKAIRASDIDMVWVTGYGWPIYRGGPMHYADHVGLKTVVERLKAYQAQMGDFFKVSPLLEKLAAEGGKLSSVSN